MEYNYKFYQIGNGGNLMFEKDLEQLIKYLGQPYPEFFGVPLNYQSGPTQWIVTADIRKRIGAPTRETIWFSVKGNSWKDALAKAMHEAIARLCGKNVNKIEGTRFCYYPRHDAMGRPLIMPLHTELNEYLAHLDFMKYKAHKELDNARIKRQAPHYR